MGALWRATVYGHMEVVQALLAAGANTELNTDIVGIEQRE